MDPIGIPGAAKLINAVRWRLHGPISLNRLDRLQPLISKGIQQIGNALAEHGDTAKLPPRVRRAYEWLQCLDLGQGFANTEDANLGTRLTGRFGGLLRNWKGILDELGQPEGSNNLDACLAEIRSLSQAVEDQLREGAFRIHEVPARARAIRGWLSYFSDGTRLGIYAKAVARARAVLAPLLPAAGALRAPFVLHFVPMRGLCKILDRSSVSRVVLPTPMIQFTKQEFEYLASSYARNAFSKHKLLDAIEEIAYLRIEDEIQLLAGAENEMARGHHDLMASFDRVSPRYKVGTVQPRLVWSVEPTKVLFSCYDRAHNTLVITRKMDLPEDSPGVIVVLIEEALLRAGLWPRVQCIPEVSAEE